MEAVKGVFSKTKDPRFLVSIVLGLSKLEIQELLPQYLLLKKNARAALFNRILHAQTPPVDPRGLLMLLHTISPHAQVPLRNIIDGYSFYNYSDYLATAIESCLTQMDVFSPEVLAAALLQLVDETPVPPLFMRTVFSVTTNE